METGSGGQPRTSGSHPPLPWLQVSWGPLECRRCRPEREEGHGRAPGGESPEDLRVKEQPSTLNARDSSRLLLLLAPCSSSLALTSRMVTSAPTSPSLGFLIYELAGVRVRLRTDGQFQKPGTRPGRCRPSEMNGFSPLFLNSLWQIGCEPHHLFPMSP